MIAAFLTLLTLSRADDYPTVFVQLENQIRRTYYAYGKRKEETEARFARYRPVAGASRSRDEFAGTVNKMIDEFGDSHFHFAIEGEQKFYLDTGFEKDKGLEMPHIGAWLTQSGWGWKIEMLLDGGPAQAAGLMQGDEIVSIEGAPFTPVRSLTPWVGRSARITFMRSGRAMEAKVAVVAERPMEMFDNASLASVRAIQTPNGWQVAYVHPWTLLGSKSKRAITEARTRFPNADAFLLDLRSGFGGRPENVLSRLKDFRGPIAILIDGGARSAREIVAYNARKEGLAALIGRRTKGAVLGTYPVQINDWSNIEIPVQEVPVDGVRLEKVGVAPDVEVPAGGPGDQDVVVALGVLDRKLGQKKSAPGKPAQGAVLATG